MKNTFVKRIIPFLLFWFFCFTACTQQEDVVVPHENCEALATVKFVPGCGLQLLLEHEQLLVPVNSSYTVGADKEPVYKINNFPVKVGKRVIVGYKKSDAELRNTACNVAGYGQGNLVDITCIVGIEPGI